MRILIVYTNSYRTAAPAPLGASLVASRLRRDGHEVQLLDLMFSKAPAQEAARVAREFRPDLIGYSIRNVDSQSYSYFYDPMPVLRTIALAVREAWSAPTLLGGTAFTTFPVQFMEAFQANYGIAGDDLEPISGFVSSLSKGHADLSTPGLVYRDQDGIHCNPYEIRGYADTSFDCWDLLNLRPYRRSFESYWEAAVVVRTGCPFQCVYCDTFRSYGRQWVLRDPRQIADELVALRCLHGVRSVFLADAGFNRPLDHAKAVLEAIIQAKPGVGLTAVFEPGEVDAEFARLFRRAGGRALMLFAGSLSDRVLAACRKPFLLDDVLKGSALLSAAGVDCFLYLTFGGPGETPDTVEETLGHIRQVRPIYTLFDHGYRIQPYTALREIAVAEGAISPDDDCFRATFYHSPDTPPATLDARLRRYQAEHRLDALRGLPWMARLAWDKLRP
ncbi:MAG: B12-binding domain-containing radical SAM protein [Sphingomonadaceae bacterium]